MGWRWGEDDGGDMIASVKSLSCKHEDLGSDASTVLKARPGSVHLNSQLLGSRDKRTCQVANLAKS